MLIPMREDIIVKNHYDRKKIKVILIPGNQWWNKRLKKELEQYGISVSFCSPFHYATLFNFVKVLILRIAGYNIIHLNWLYIFPFIFIMKLFVYFSKSIGYKIVWSPQNILPHNHTWKDIIKSRWLCTHSDFVFIPFESNVKRYKQIVGVSPKKFAIVNHPYQDFCPNEISQSEARKKLKIPLDKKVLLCFGLIRWYKGMDIFVKLLEKLGNEFYGIIAGKGMDKDLVEFIEKKSKELDNLRFYNAYIREDELQIYFNASDAVILPYKNKDELTFGGNIMLAFTFGKPVVSLNVGGIAEVVTPDRGILIDDPENVDELVAAVKLLFEKDYRKMGKNAQKFAVSQTWKDFARITIDGYHQVLKEEE